MGKRTATIIGAIFGALGGGAIGSVITLIFMVILAVSGHYGGIGPNQYDAEMWLWVLSPIIVMAGLGGLLGGLLARILRKWGLIFVVPLGTILAGLVAFLWLSIDWNRG